MPAWNHRRRVLLGRRRSLPRRCHELQTEEREREVETESYARKGVVVGRRRRGFRHALPLADADRWRKCSAAAGPLPLNSKEEEGRPVTPSRRDRVEASWESDHRAQPLIASPASPPLEPPRPDTPLLCSLPQRRCRCSPFVVAAPPLLRGLPPVRFEGEEMRSEEQAGSYHRCCQLLDAVQAAAPAAQNFAAVAGELCQ
ncbi:uncharacterized protein DS421_15g507040 [Arachis hypogaea]|nr:uncharacterized protein DS421_15g507040 [Arachis hypogaea]